MKIAPVAPVVAPEHKHGVPVHHGGVAVSGAGRRAGNRQDLGPHHGVEAELEEVVDALTAVEPRKHKEGVPVHHSRVPVAGRRRYAPGANMRPRSRADIELVEIVDPI